MKKVSLILSMLVVNGAIVLFTFTACNDFLNTWEGYCIDKGDHNSKRCGTPARIINLKDGRVMKFDARFGDGCLYDINKTDGEGDLNKLYGFTDCNSTVHENSVRFAWRHDGKGVIEIFGYLYKGGKRKYWKMGETSQYKADSYELIAKHDMYYFRFNDKDTTLLRSKDCEHGVRTRLYPYFGGNRPAPNDMIVFIKEYD